MLRACIEGAVSLAIDWPSSSSLPAWLRVEFCLPLVLGSYIWEIWYGGGELKGISDLAQTCKKSLEVYLAHDSLVCAEVWRCLAFYIFLLSGVNAGTSGFWLKGIQLIFPE